MFWFFFLVLKAKNQEKKHDSNSMNKLARYAVNSFNAKENLNNKKNYIAAILRF